MSLEALDGFIDVEFTNVDTLICGAGGEARVGLPVHVQRGRTVERKLLSAIPGRRVPDYRRLETKNKNNDRCCHGRRKSNHAEICNARLSEVVLLRPLFFLNIKIYAPCRLPHSECNCPACSTWAQILGPCADRVFLTVGRPKSKFSHTRRTNQLRGDFHHTVRTHITNITNTFGVSLRV